MSLPTASAAAVTATVGSWVHPVAFCRPPLPQHIRDITDPEHPYTLEQLSVVSEEAIQVDDAAGTVQVSSWQILAPAVQS